MFTPYDFQKEAILSILHYFKSGKGKNPLVVAPTGSGKSVIISCFIEFVKKKWPSQKVLIISHVKEILQQNLKAIKRQMPNEDIGLYSAGMKSREVKDITVAGIQSIYNKSDLFKNFNIIIVDECHTIPTRNDGMYRLFLKKIKKPIIGFTATPFRLGHGYLHLGEEKIFDDIVYNIPIKKLQREGYLCPLVTRGSKEKMDTKDIRKQAGDYVIKDLALAFNREEITKRIILSLLDYKKTRKKWLIFAINIEHCEQITKQLNTYGVKARFVHSRMKQNREEVIKDFKNGEYQALVSVAVLTTGFDVPDIDLIALLRPTASPVLHIQIIGRGLRTAEGKKDCLILDYAGNLLRNGPIDSPIVKSKGIGVEGEAPLKECEECYEIVHIAVKFCPNCNHEFLFRHNLTQSSKETGLLTKSYWHKVIEVEYLNYIGSKGIPILKVSYICGIRRFSEYICLEHDGYARYKARFWWSRRSEEEPPIKVARACELAYTLKKPKEILVNESGRYSVIEDQKFEGEEE